MNKRCENQALLSIFEYLKFGSRFEAGICFEFDSTSYPIISFMYPVNTQANFCTWVHDHRPSRLSTILLRAAAAASQLLLSQPASLRFQSAGFKTYRNKAGEAQGKNYDSTTRHRCGTNDCGTDVCGIDERRARVCGRVFTEL